MLSINILPNILKHQSDGSHYHERKTKHFNRKQYKNHETKIEKIIINRKILSKVLKHQSDGSKYNFGKKHNITKKSNINIFKYRREKIITNIKF